MDQKPHSLLVALIFMALVFLVVGCVDRIGSAYFTGASYQTTSGYSEYYTTNPYDTTYYSSSTYETTVTYYTTETDTFTTDYCTGEETCNGCTECDGGSCVPQEDSFGKSMSLCDTYEDGSELCCGSDEVCTDGAEELSAIQSDEECSEETTPDFAAEGKTPQENCDQEDECDGKVTVKCIPDKKFCKKYPGAGGMCDKKCTITLPSKTCETMGINPPVGSTTIPSSTIENQDCSVDGDIDEIKRCCNAKHENQHAEDLSKEGCPLCESESDAYDVSKDCLDEQIESCPTGIQTQDDCNRLSYESDLSDVYKAYQQCLCDSLAPGKTDRYDPGTCNACKSALEADIQQINDEHSDEDIGTRDPAADASEASKMYCEGKEK